jgi:predicted ATPase/DNA-binding SARP family transcriptional activator
MVREAAFLKVTTLGRFSVLRDQDRLSGGHWNRRRVCELFKILLSAEQHRLHREQVQELLWPSSSREQAANSFGKTLYLLRRALEPDLAVKAASAYVALEQDILFLIPQRMEIDADLFEMRARQIQGQIQGGGANVPVGQDLFDELDSVLALYGGDYLPDDLYEDWALRRRDRLRRTYSSLLERAALAAIASAQGQRASEYLHILLEQNATDEAMHRELMLIYARMGRRDEAIGQYQRLRDILREELRTVPLPETQDLYRAIRAGRVHSDLSPPSHLSSRQPAPELSSVPTHIHAHAVADEHFADVPRSVLPSTAIQERKSSPLPLPEPVRQTELVGRSEELQRLCQGFAPGPGEQRRVFFVSGEAGIGKTRLARELSSWAEKQSALVMWGACYEVGGTLPYQPLIDVLTAHMRARSPEQLRAALGKSAVDLAKIVPEVRMVLPDLPPPEPLGAEVERRNLYHAVARYFHLLASAHPLLLILDDLQWVDSATVQLLSYIFQQEASQGARAQAIPFFVLLYRADEVHEAHPLRDLLEAQFRAGRAEEIRLKRLREEEVHQLLTHMAGHEVRSLFSEEIYKYTEGNPLFIGESIRTLIEEGKVKKIDGRWQTTIALKDLALPQRVRILIERRLAYLSPACRMTLAYAALLGRQFHSSLLCQARDLPEESIAEHVDEAMRAHILTELDAERRGQDADLMFTHDKIREVLALWLNPLRRRVAHRQIAQAIEAFHTTRLQTYYSLLAYHYERAEERAKAGEYLRKAAEEAIAVYAFVEAAEYMERALGLLLGEENRAQRAELLRRLSVDAYLYSGRPDKAIEAGIAACALWQEMGEAAKEAESRLDVAFSFHWMGRESEALAHIQRALTCLAHTPDEKRLLAKAHVQWGLSATISGDMLKALEELQHADELHAQVGGQDPFISVVSLWSRSWCAFAGGTLQEMLDYARRSIELCRAIHMFAWEPMMTYSAAWALMLMGRLTEATQVARETLEKARRHNAVGAQGWANLVLSFVAIQQGDWETADRSTQDTIEIAQMMHDADLRARALWGRSICAGWQEDWKRAIARSLEALHTIEEGGELSLVYPYLLLQAAKAHFYAGQGEKAQHYLDRAMSFARQHHYRQVPAIGYRIQGRILQAQADFERAPACFEQSLAALTALSDTVELARTQEAYGLFFQTRNRAGDQERGAALLQEARTTFARLGVKG